MNKVHFSSKSNEWATPQYLFNFLDSKYNFDLDPASDGNNNKCKKFYTQKENGLLQDWDQITFCNPPYGRELGKWIEKGYLEHQKHNKKIVMLIPARPDTKAWHNFIFGKAKVVFIKGRVKFGDGTSPAPFPSAIIIYGEKGFGTLDLKKIIKSKENNE